MWSEILDYFSPHLFFVCVAFQPSSSLRAAELLEASTGGLVTFSGFATAESGLALGASGFGDESCEGTVDDPEFTIVLKRLAKKDSTTKLKVYHCF